jgi:tripartite-type tricarboxylate transporter receptor subunit TctC
MVETVPAAQGFIKAGKLRALAVTTPQRISMLPDVPTANEEGLTGFSVSSMFGVLAPANTPKPVVDRLNAELVKILQMPEVKEQLLQQGAYAMSTSPDQTSERIRQEISMWAKVIEEAKITND